MKQSKQHGDHLPSSYDQRMGLRVLCFQRKDDPQPGTIMDEEIFDAGCALLVELDNGVELWIEAELVEPQN